MRIAILTTENREHFRNYHDSTPTFGSAPWALVQGFIGMQDVEVHIVSCAKQPMTSPEKLASNIYFHSLPVPKIGWMRTAYQGCIRAVRRKFQEIRPDIAHGQGTERDCAISAAFSGCPNVITVHGNMRMIAKLNRARPLSFQWLASRLEGITIPRSCGVVCITKYTQGIVSSLAKKTWVIPNAVELDFFDIGPKPTVIPQILCVGSIEERKNQNALIRAMDTLKSQIKFELVFIGGVNSAGSYGREFLDLVSTRPWVRYAGFADRTMLKRHLETASGLALPSVEDNCPMVVLEAMAAGIPVAAARVGGVPELLRHGETGLLFDPLNHETIASELKKLLSDGSREMAERARAEAHKRFHPNVVARQHIDVYREVLLM